MDLYLGVDLGSTTSKAVVVGGDGAILGRGITNTRSNYKVASEIAREEALHSARFSYLLGEMEALGYPPSRHAAVYSDLDTFFRFEGYLLRLGELEKQCLQSRRSAGDGCPVPEDCLREVFALLRE